MAPEGSVPVQTPNSANNSKVVQAGNSDRDHHVSTGSGIGRTLRSKRFMSSDDAPVTK